MLTFLQICHSFNSSSINVNRRHFLPMLFPCYKLTLPVQQIWVEFEGWEQCNANRYHYSEVAWALEDGNLLCSKKHWKPFLFANSEKWCGTAEQSDVLLEWASGILGGQQPERQEWQGGSLCQDWLEHVLGQEMVVDSLLFAFSRHNLQQRLIMKAESRQKKFLSKNVSVN